MYGTFKIGLEFETFLLWMRFLTTKWKWRAAMWILTLSRTSALAPWAHGGKDGLLQQDEFNQTFAILFFFSFLKIS